MQKVRANSSVSFKFICLSLWRSHLKYKFLLLNTDSVRSTCVQVVSKLHGESGNDIRVSVPEPHCNYNSNGWQGARIRTPAQIKWFEYRLRRSARRIEVLSTAPVPCSHVQNYYKFLIRDCVAKFICYKKESLSLLYLAPVSLPLVNLEIMNPSDIPSSQGFAVIPANARPSVKERGVSRRSSGLRSSCQSAKLSRNSSTTRSIKIFADVKDLLGIRGSSHIRIPDDPENSAGYRTSFTEDIPVSNRGDAEHFTSQDGLQTTELQSENDTRSSDDSREQQSPTPDTPPSEEKAPRENTESSILYEYFPRPPPQIFRNEHRSVLVQFDTHSTPESSESASTSTEKLPPRIDKSLPQPPYHSFTHKKKIMVVTLVSLAGSLSPLSNIIYFPALNDIAAV